MLRDPTIINFDRLTTSGIHRAWADKEVGPTAPLPDAPTILGLVAEEIFQTGNGAGRHAHGRHDVLTMLAVACGDPGGHQHNRARVALERFVREIGEAGIREWARDNDAPTLIVGLRACAELMRVKEPA